jgi:mannan endo-1,4-beta-mannosidase
VRLGFIALLLVACSGGAPESARHPDADRASPSPTPADEKTARPTTLSPAAETMRKKLAALATGAELAFGHEDTTAYGVGWQGDSDRSDVKSLCGHHAAVHGWDLGDLEKSPRNLDGVPFETIRRLIVDAHRRGIMNTVSVHLDNPVSGGDAWDTTHAVSALVPGGARHSEYRALLDRIAEFFRSLRSDDGTLVPILFRPFHEHNGNWFWWGRAHATDAEYVALFRFTVSYLRGERRLDNLLVAFSPGAANVETEADYFFRYPGDDVVDVFGLDHYYGNDASELVHAVELAVTAAEHRGKIAALTEFGVHRGLSNPLVDVEHWFTRKFLEPLLESPKARGLSYALAWRNANPEHFFVPYPGHAAAPDFQAFCAAPEILLEGDIAPSPGPKD